MNHQVQNKKTLTTGEIAEHCGVNFRTVIRWIDRGLLKAYKLPGRGDNRVQVRDFLSFLHQNNMPIPETFGPNDRRALIVDDDPAAAKAIQRTLRQAGFDTRIASDGFGAGTLLESFEPSAVTLDLNMPGIGGLEVIRYIRENPRFASVKILVVSALDQARLDEAVASGADDALAKPYRNEELVNRVLAMVGATESAG